jgi:hypothetical protein
MALDRRRAAVQQESRVRSIEHPEAGHLPVREEGLLP